MPNKKSKSKHNYWQYLLKEYLNQDQPNATHYYLPKKNHPNQFSSATRSTKITISSPKIHNRYQLNEPYEGVYLTQREWDTLQAIDMEKTISGAARKLQLSARTVEFYFENVKKKLKCKKKKQLLNLIYQHIPTVIEEIKKKK